MARLFLVMLCLGCSDRPIDLGDSNRGGKACSGLDEKSCNASKGCVADYCTNCSCDHSESFIGCRRPSDPSGPCPLHSCPACPSCAGLGEMDCLANAQTLGCVPDYCPDCMGGQYFLDCLPNSAGSGECPASCPVFGCHSMQDCKSGYECVAPGESPGCGICELGMACNSDGDCGVGEICTGGPCICTNTGKACQPGCAAGGCPEGMMCGQSNHCIPIFCSVASDCPTFFDCVSGQCQRRPCSADPDCPGGACVNSACYPSLGQCEPLPA
jgi:hypothetical protein